MRCACTASTGPRGDSPVKSRRGRRDVARAAVVGGVQDTIEQVPWQVAVFAEFEWEGEQFSLMCGGAIIDSTHVVTAGHCTYNPITEAPIPTARFVVVAGATKITEQEIKHGPRVEARALSAVRRHPYYDFEAGAGTPDDVAVLALATPLKHSGAVQTIALPSSQLVLPEGLGATLSGYGLENPRAERPNGNLYSLATTLESSRSCGGDVEADFLCARSNGGSACNGDSGGGLTREVDGVRTLIGLVDFVQVIGGEACLPGSLDGFVNVTTPEIRDFIEGSESPPLAPRGGGAQLAGEAVVGALLSCEPGAWSNGPTFSYTFFNGANGDVLQEGDSATYAVSEADVGREIGCLVTATTAGGIATARTALLAPVPPAPPSGEPPATSSSLAQGARQGIAGVTIAKIAAVLRHELTPKRASARRASVLRSDGYTLIVSAPERGTEVMSWYVVPHGSKHARRKAKPVLVASGRVAFAAAGKKKLKLRLTSAGRSLLKRSRSLRLTATATFTPHGRTPVTVTTTFVLR